MKLFITPLFVNLIFIIHCYAGVDNLPVGAKQAGMGNAAVASSDIWSVYHNQAGLANIDKTTASINASQGYFLKQTSLASVAIAYPTKLGTFAISYNRFGYSLYNESKTGFAYARKFGEGLRIGAQANLNSVALGENYGKRTLATFEIGVQTKILKNLWIGAHFYNFSRSKINSIEKVPVIVKFGVYYTFNTNVNATIEYEKNWVTKPLFKAGLEYKLAKEFSLRVGINGGSNVSTFVGAGYLVKKFRIDAACAFDQKLGASPNISLTYSF